ncbi:MAG: hypothetical protein ACOZAO_05340 [Patescibacteria group bacterium]
MKGKATLYVVILLLVVALLSGCTNEEAVSTLTTVIEDATGSTQVENTNPDQGGTINVSGTANLDIYAHYPQLANVTPLEDFTLTSPASYGYSVRIVNYSHLSVNSAAAGQYLDLLHWFAWNKVTALDMKNVDHYIYIKNVPTTQHVLVIVPQEVGASVLMPEGNNVRGGTQTGTNGTFAFSMFNAQTLDVSEKGKNELRLLVELCNSFIGAGNNGYNSGESDAFCNSYATATVLKAFGLKQNLQEVIDASKDGQWGSYTFMYINSWDAYIGAQVTN